MRSLRSALIVGTTVATALVLSAAGVLLYTLARASLLEQTDRAIIDKAALIASGVEANNGEIKFDLAPFHLSGNDPLDSRDHLQLWRDDGTVVFRSPSLGETGLEPFAAAAHSATYRWVPLPDGRQGRAVGITFLPRAEEETEGREDKTGRSRERNMGAPILTLVLARDTAPTDATLAGLRGLLAVVGCAAIGVSAGVLLLVIRRSLRPLDRLAAEIGRLGEQDLSARIDVPGTPRELEPVTARLNDLLGRLEAAFERERGFSADVAHELRTPLAGLRATIDVTLSRARRSADYAEALEDCRQITARMQAMVENLTSLARLEAGQVALQPQPCALGGLVRDHWKPLASLADARQLRVEWATDADCTVVADEAQLGLVVHNILENAVAYADSGGRVRIATSTSDHHAMLTVANSGSKVAQDQVENVFKRFWRGDEARSDTGVHCGLGLALTRKITTLLGGSVAVRSETGGEFEITISIPILVCTYLADPFKPQVPGDVTRLDA